MKKIISQTAPCVLTVKGLFEKEELDDNKHYNHSLHVQVPLLGLLSKIVKDSSVKLGQIGKSSYKSHRCKFRIEKLILPFPIFSVY